MSAHTRKKLSCIVCIHQWQPLLEIAGQLNICQNITWLYQHELGFNNCITSKKPFFSDEHKANKRAFACAQEDWIIEDWSNVIWSNKLQFKIGKKSNKIRT